MAKAPLVYLEFVTDDPRATRAALGKAFGWRFAPRTTAAFGGAFVARLTDGSRCGVRGRLHPEERAVTRAYAAVEDVAAAAAAAEKAGATVLMGPTEIPGQGRFAIWRQGGVEHGAWEAPQAGRRPRRRGARLTSASARRRPRA